MNCHFKKLFLGITAGIFFNFGLTAQLPPAINEFYSCSIAEAADAEASSPAEFTQALYQHLLARHTDFSIIYHGNYDDVFTGNMDDMLNPVYSIHQDGNTDDLDYLQYNLDRSNVSIPAITSSSEFIFNIKYRESADERGAVNNTINSVLPQLMGNTTYDTVKNIHDFIVNEITYDNSLTRYTAYNGLIGKSCVCQGYALLTYKMLTAAGIPCRYITGYAGESHAWNIVKMDDNKWYNLDTTWDDPVGAGPQLRYDYFLIGSNKMLQDHTPNDEFLTTVFTNEHPISISDYDADSAVQNTAPSTPQTYQKVRRHIVSKVDDDFKYTDANQHEKMIIDLCKKVVVNALAQLPEQKLDQLANDPAKLDTAFDLAFNRINAVIFNPIEQYIDSDQYTTDITTDLEAELAKSDKQHMTPEQFQVFQESITEELILKHISAKFEQISSQHSASLINELTAIFQKSI